MQSLQQLPPAAFLDKMSRLLGEEYDNFLQSYAQPPRKGLRVNTLKISAADFSRKSPFALKAVGAYAPEGFLLTGDGRPGQHPYHAAGLYYLQEPSAMAVAGLVAPQPGEWVLDLAAAPGGKATHLAARMQDRGLLVANDVDRKRAKILVENLERWGVRNALVTNAQPDHLVRQFGPIFDRVLLDAPCSGEGMFRRLGDFDWGEGLVQACARRQTAVIESAAQLVKPGGRLVYVTCTFSPEENEAVIARFLAAHPDFQLIDPPRQPGFDRGRPSWVAEEWRTADLDKTIRLWPHKFAGEGHFVAVMARLPGSGGRLAAGGERLPVGQAALAVWRHFAATYLAGAWPEDRLGLHNGRLYLLPEQTWETSGLHLLRYGLLLGEIRKKHFKPAHALAMALRPSEVRHCLNWPADAPEIRAYLTGQTLPVAAPKGWVLLCVDGFALGWGKVANGRLQNHYPRGLRPYR